MLEEVDHNSSSLSKSLRKLNKGLSSEIPILKKDYTLNLRNHASDYPHKNSVIVDKDSFEHLEEMVGINLDRVMRSKSPTG